MNIPFRFTTHRFNNRIVHFAALIVFVLYAIFYLSTLAGVPFHPDESTQIYMSSDVDMLLTSIDRLYWNPDLDNDLRQHYRLLDAPLTRYLIGATRLINQSPALPNDWDWSLSWQQNSLRGALPQDSLLYLARLSVAWLALLSLFFFYDIVQKISSPLIAFPATLMLAFSPLFLLHTRRAMSESALLFFCILSIWVMLRFPHRPIILGLSCALALCSKQSAAVLFIPAVFTIVSHSESSTRIKSKIVALLLFLTAVAAVILVLNPFLWNDPLHAMQQAWQQRVSLTRQQQDYIFERSPEKQTADLVQKTASLIGALYFQAPAVADVANYLQETSEASRFYFSNPLNNLFHDPLFSAIQLALALPGLVFFVLHAVKEGRGFNDKFLILLVFLCFASSLLLLTPLPFQRYYILLLPWFHLWTVYALIAPFTFKNGVSPVDGRN